MKRSKVALILKTNNETQGKNENKRAQAQASGKIQNGGNWEEAETCIGGVVQRRGSSSGGPS